MHALDGGREPRDSLVPKKEIGPRFCATHMLDDYVRSIYRVH